MTPNTGRAAETGSLLLLTGGDAGLLGTLDLVTSSLDLLLGLTGVLEVLDDDLGLKVEKVR